MDIVIVGAGPVGLYASYYAGFRAMQCLVLEALPFTGGQIATFYADSTIYDVAGFPRVTGAELLERLERQARSFDTEIRLGARVTGIDATAQGVRIRWAPEDDAAAAHTIDCSAVLLTTGIGRFAPQPLRLPAIEPWLGRGLDYHVSDPSRFAGRRVLVAGGTQRGVELAVDLAERGATVFLIHRRDRLPVPEALRTRLDASTATFLPYRELAALEGEARVTRAVLQDRRSGDRETLAVEAVLPCFGYAADKDTLGNFGVPIEDGAIPVDSRMAAAAGIWAAGDAATYPGKVRVLAADFGEACTAVNNIAATILPGASVFPGYSSHTGGAPRETR